MENEILRHTQDFWRVYSRCGKQKIKRTGKCGISNWFFRHFIFDLLSSSFAYELLIFGKNCILSKVYDLMNILSCFKLHLLTFPLYVIMTSLCHEQDSMIYELMHVHNITESYTKLM